MPMRGPAGSCTPPRASPRTGRRGRPGLGRTRGVATAIATAAATYLAVAGRELGRGGAARRRRRWRRPTWHGPGSCCPALVGRDVTALDVLGHGPRRGGVGRREHASTPWSPRPGGRRSPALPAPSGTGPSTPWTPWWAIATTATAVTAGPAPASTTSSAFVPARLTALLVAAVRPGWRAGASGVPFGTQAPAHPSPNAGVAEAAFAAALGCSPRRGEPLRRDAPSSGRSWAPGVRPRLGDIDRAVGLCDDVRVALGPDASGRRRGAVPAGAPGWPAP